MPAGTLTVHQSFGSLVGLAAVVRIESTIANEVVYAPVGSPAFRLVFTLDAPGSDLASSFVVTTANGSATYAEGDYAVSLAALDLALGQGNTAGAVAAIFGGLTTIALSSGADVDLVSMTSGLRLQGNDLGTYFSVTESATIVDAGGGNDEIAVRADFSDGRHIDGGEGDDTLLLVDAVANVRVDVAQGEIWVQDLDNSVVTTFAGIEFFRELAGNSQFFANGEGMRFEGGAGIDQFLRLGVEVFADTVDYSGEDGGFGIVLNLDPTLDTSNLSGLQPDLAAALLNALGSDTFLPVNFARDTFGDTDYVDWGFVVVGSVHADVFYGSADADAFDGDAGGDRFFGGGGDDTIEGGDGDDTLYFSADEDDYQIAFAAGVFTITGLDGTDTVSGVETFSFADGTVASAAYAPAAPIAHDDSNGLDSVVEGAAGVAGDATATGFLLDNDSDPNGDTLSVVAARAGGSGAFAAVGSSAPILGKYGSLTILGGGTWTYTLNDLDSDTDALQAGTIAHDIFTYRVSDGGLEGEATLDIAIAGSNDPAAGGADTLTTSEDVAVSVGKSVLTSNDIDPEGEAITLISVQSAVNGTVELSGSDVLFTPTAGYHGSASFTYTAEYALGGTLTRQVDVAINSVNDAPNGTGATLTVLENGALSLTATDFGFTDGSDGNGLLSVIITVLPVLGTLKLGSTAVLPNQEIPAAQLGGLSWAAPLGQSGNGFATIGFKVRDDGGTANGGVDVDVSAGIVTINVTPVNDAPSAADATITVGEDSSYVFSPSDFGFVDTDTGDVLQSVTVTSLPSGGVLKLAGVAVVAGQSIGVGALSQLIFTPEANVNGSPLTSFGFTVSDGLLQSDDKTVTINVSAVNDAPHFVLPAGVGPLSLIQLSEGISDVPVPSVTDVDDTTLRYRLEGPDAGVFTFIGGVFRFISAPDYESPTDSDGDNVYNVTLVVSDGEAFDAHAVSVTITDVGGNVVWGTTSDNRINLLNKVAGLGATEEADAIHGGGGKDTIASAGGNDTLYGGDGKDDLDGGAGFDIADYGDKKQAVVLTLNGALQASVRVGVAVEDRVRNIEGIIGGKAADKLTGDAVANLLMGGSGDDVLTAKLGNDTLSGGGGKDRFVFDTKLGAANLDTVTDFRHGKDVVVLDDAIFKKIGPSLTGNEFYAKAGATQAHDADDRIIYDSTTGRLCYDDDGNKAGGHSPILFATLSTKPLLDAGDFAIA